MQDPAQLRQLQIVAGALIVGPVIFVGMALFLRAKGTTMGNFEEVSYLAIGYAFASPMVASAVRAQMSPLPAVQPPRARRVRAATIVPLAILESAVFLCAIALLLTPTYWPLGAAAVPLGTMLAWFPRAA
jgi:hypothetical protein